MKETVNQNRPEARGKNSLKKVYYKIALLKL
jgi:hypothetical protein